jgi:hypothetical protein
MYSLRWSTAPWWDLPDPKTDRMTFGRYLPWTDMAVGRMDLMVGEFTRTANQSPDVGQHMLFDVTSDPEQNDNLAGTILEERYIADLEDALHACHAPPEQFVRLGLR